MLLLLFCGCCGYFGGVVVVGGGDISVLVFLFFVSCFRFCFFALATLVQVRLREGMRLPHLSDVEGLVPVCPVELGQFLILTPSLPQPVKYPG